MSVSTWLTVLNIEGQITSTQENKSGDGKGHLCPVITSSDLFSVHLKMHEKESKWACLKIYQNSMYSKDIEEMHIFVNDAPQETKSNFRWYIIKLGNKGM